MKLDHFFFVFMAAVGIAAGVVLTVAPQAAETIVRPYFWILIAAAPPDIGCFLRSSSAAQGGGATRTMLSIEARLLGFVIGIVVMIVVKSMTGSPASVF
jgi:hypothetical protein